MAKLPGRIPAEQVASAKGWQPPEIQQSENSRLIKLQSRTPPAKMLLSKPVSKTPATEVHQPETDKREATMPAPPKPDAKATSKPRLADPVPDSDDASAGAAIAVDSTDPQPEVVFSEPPKTEADGFFEGFKKGETEGFVKGEKAGYDAGMIAGTEAGREQAETTFNQEVAGQREAITGLQQAFLAPPNYDAELQLELVTLITELTKTVIGRELKTQPQLIQTLVSQALKALPHGADHPRVFVNPSDMELLQSVSHQDVEFVADAGLARGGCRVLAGQSSVEAGVALRIRDALMAACRGEEIVEITESDMQELEARIEVQEDGAE